MHIFAPHLGGHPPNFSAGCRLKNKLLLFYYFIITFFEEIKSTDRDLIKSLD